MGVVHCGRSGLLLLPGVRQSLGQGRAHRRWGYQGVQPGRLQAARRDLRRALARVDQKPLSTDWANLLEVELMPMARRVPKGNRIRLAVTNADKDNFTTPIISPAPKVTIYFGSELSSSLTLPVATKVP